MEASVSRAWKQVFRVEYIIIPNITTETTYTQPQSHTPTAILSLLRTRLFPPHVPDQIVGVEREGGNIEIYLEHTSQAYRIALDAFPFQVAPNVGLSPSCSSPHFCNAACLVSPRLDGACLKYLALEPLCLVPLACPSLLAISSAFLACALGFSPSLCLSLFLRLCGVCTA